ncbi:hydrogenase nickel incorporation protein HypB [Pseudomonas sp. 10B1]|uniref:hydrogenase nickel incorporation protein HypB n=1 Tax=unclassified Pseudomonas TaxID=196821 RepID=UPI002AB46DA4|nr:MULTISPECIES: hydrogenase nickel incorporation protein HypB [unclassified Pseudomonas]MDY7559645.1 hydrogenase nickel incorporation protein HypB [Pseudomonas sp. AB6]MEA9977979.1 hydrogenase nickel incorporation protein HypB [Pseudomonas sp. RTS4]MEA9993119.1 hydrogenase nickel incorporation protein HypB [Pseudomonas sp. AA4]MEB0086061.1 hydrogenase nickel incorporation protein HypB [Pseudomonas sp. RTI1]MEB0125503.1 hydrogenase nickel incorporation protein HypB [Pseudomonas sp. CCC1.2]
MCVVCGCGTGHSHEQDPSNEAAPDSDVQVDATGDLHYGAGQARVSVPGLSQARTIRIEQDVLGENDRHAARNRQNFTAHGVLALNLVSSPGSGKTTLLCATLLALRARQPGLPLAVIEGDQQTRHDAERIRETGVAAIQINTGKGCHLDARMITQAYARLPLHDELHAAGHGHSHAKAPLLSNHHTHNHHPKAADEPAGILFIENVGNLVCPALWDLGEAGKVAILSVTEGEDKPLKYPDMFAAAQLMILNKIDLLPHLDFDVQRCLDYAHQVNPQLQIIQLSARDGTGLDAWIDWLLAGAPQMDRRAARIAALEAELAALKISTKEA